MIDEQISDIFIPDDWIELLIQNSRLIRGNESKNYNQLNQLE